MKPINKILKTLHRCTACQENLSGRKWGHTQYGLKHIPDFCENCGEDQRPFKQALEKIAK